jgi:hypothetical protein
LHCWSSHGDPKYLRFYFILTKCPTRLLIAATIYPVSEYEGANMLNNFMTKLTVITLGLALSVHEALAMGWIDDGGSGSPGSAPELDGAGSIAVIGVIVSVALVLYNRSKHR